MEIRVKDEQLRDVWMGDSRNAVVAYDVLLRYMSDFTVQDLDYSS